MKEVVTNISAGIYIFRGTTTIIAGTIFLIVSLFVLFSSWQMGLIFLVISLLIIGVGILLILSAKRVRQGLPPLVRSRRRIGGIGRGNVYIRD